MDQAPSWPTKGGGGERNNKGSTTPRRKPQKSRSPMRKNSPHHQAIISPTDSGNAAGFFDDVAISTSKRNHHSPHRNHHSPHRGVNQQYHSNHPNHPRNINRRKHNAKSPPRPKQNNKARSKSPKKGKVAAPMTVICNRVDLYDCKSKNHYNYDSHSDDECGGHQHLPHPNLPVASYSFVTTPPEESKPFPVHSPSSVAVVRAPKHFGSTGTDQILPEFDDVIDNSIPNPHEPDKCHDKYWAQRRRLFWKFDMGIQLDPEGWYSVTPEAIARHVATRVAASVKSTTGSSSSAILLDAFTGCGGNAIAFGAQSSLDKVVCCDIDRSKLRKAAYNACLYEVSPYKLVFVECSSLYIMKHCYKDGILSLEHLPNPPQDVETEECAGFLIGGLGMLPPRIDAIFMDPPWGGVDYNSLGKNGYCLEKHMKIKVASSTTTTEPDDTAEPKAEAAVTDDFFDSFGTTAKPENAIHHNMTAKQAKKKFNQKKDGGVYWNGVDLLKIAASATSTRLVVYDMPRNTSKSSLGKCALAAGYRGNLKLEEHYLNGRLKTVTAYMGADYCSTLICTDPEHHGEVGTGVVDGTAAAGTEADGAAKAREVNVSGSDNAATGDVGAGSTGEL